MNPLQIAPATLEEANEFVRRHHRHHQTVQGHKFSLAAYEKGPTPAMTPLAWIFLGVLLIAICVVAHL